jgi:hypothetical protein
LIVAQGSVAGRVFSRASPAKSYDSGMELTLARWVNARLSHACKRMQTREPGQVAIEKSLALRSPCGRYIRADAFDGRRVFFGAVVGLVG